MFHILQRATLVLVGFIFLIQVNGQSSMHNYYQALGFLQKNELEKAEEFFISSLQDGCDQTTVFIHLGKIQKKNGNITKAIEYFSEAEKYDKNSASYYLAQIYADLGEFDQALSYLYNNIHSSHFVCNYQLMQDESFTELKSNSKWIDFWKENSYSTSASKINELAYLLYMDQPEDAINELNQILSKRKKWAQAYYYRGLAYTQLNEFEFAAEDFKSACKYDDDNALYFQHQAKAWMKDKNYKKANKAANLALELNPYEPENLFLYAECLFKMGNTIEAQSTLNKYTTYFRDYKSSLLKAKILLETGQQEEALSIIQELIKNEKRTDETYFLRGSIYHQMNLFDQAINDYSMALDLNPKEYTTYMNRGNCYLMIENTEKACKDFSKALELGYGEAYNLIIEYCQK